MLMIQNVIKIFLNVYSELFSKKAWTSLYEFIFIIQRDLPRAPFSPYKSRCKQPSLSLSVPNHLQNIYPSSGIADNVNGAPSL